MKHFLNKIKQSTSSEQREALIVLITVAIAGIALGAWKYYESINFFTFSTLEEDARTNTIAVERVRQNPIASDTFVEYEIKPFGSASDFVDTAIDNSNTNPAAPDLLAGSVTDSIVFEEGGEAAPESVTDEEVAEAEAYLRSIGIADDIISSFSREDVVLYAGQSQKTVETVLNQQNISLEQLALINTIANKSREPSDWTPDEIRSVMQALEIPSERYAQASDEELYEMLEVLYNQVEQVNNAE